MTKHVVAADPPVNQSQPTLEEQVEFHEARVKRDPKGAIGWAMLAEAHLAVARAHDDDTAAAEAEKAAKQSLKVREIGNHRAATRLTEAYLAQHKFIDAEGSARLAYRLAGESASSTRMLADVLLELGKYEEFKSLTLKKEDLALTPDGAATLARWNEVVGHPETSISLLQSALKMVEDSGSANASVAAWYRNQLAFAFLRNGEREQARHQFATVLESEVNNHRALYGLAKLAYEDREFSKAIELCDKALAEARLTDTLGLKALCLKESGDKPGYEKILAKLHELNGSPVDQHGKAEEGRHTHSRLYAAFLVQAGEKLRLAHHMAEEDLEWRKDIHAYDAFAWATYQYWKHDPRGKREEGNFLLQESLSAIRKATALGTKDLEIKAHEAEILKDAKAEGLLK
ncbi:MAG TPA: tetratricopeptide repeat protein [Fimbriimonas sp.]|nr:tetratricopeptide repeat protein [Fimbriimonas sp.]